MGGRRSIAALGTIVLLVVLLAVYFWRNEPDRAPAPPTPAPGRGEASAEPIVLLPEGEAEEFPVDPRVEKPSSDGGAARRTITVLGPGGVPLEGVTLRHPGAGSDTVTTDSEGGAMFTGDLPPGDVELVVGGRLPLGTRKLAAGESVLSFPDLLPLSVEVRDGVTGRMIWDAAVRLTHEKVEKLELVWENDVLLLDPSPLTRGKKAAVKLEVHLPKGYRIRGAPWRRTTTVGRFTDALHATVVAWPTVFVRVRVKTHDGRPVEGARVSLRAPGVGVSWGLPPTNALGETSADFVPLIPGERVYASADLGNRSARSQSVTLREPVDEVILNAVLPQAENIHLVAINSSIGISGGVGHSVGFRGGRRTLRSKFVVRIRVRVLRRYGAPGGRVRVRAEGERGKRTFGRTDGNGVVVFIFTDVGPIRVRVDEPGFLMGFPVEVVIGKDSAGKTIDVLIREAEGDHVDVLVLDHEGASVPFAEISVVPPGGAWWSHVVDGIQQLNLVTDLWGRVQLPDLPGGEVTVRATYGSRSATAKVSGGGAVEIRLPPPR